jgi:hypothetical protein
MLPPGLLMLVTRPSLTGSLPVVNTIGTVAVAALSRKAASVFETITAGFRAITSFANSARRSNWFSAQRNSIATF